MSRERILKLSTDGFLKAEYTFVCCTYTCVRTYSVQCVQCVIEARRQFLLALPCYISLLFIEGIELASRKIKSLVQPCHKGVITRQQ